MRKLLIIMADLRCGRDAASQPLLALLQANVGGEDSCEGLTILITSIHHIHFRMESPGP